MQTGCVDNGNGADSMKSLFSDVAYGMWEGTVGANVAIVFFWGEGSVNNKFE